MDNLEDELQLFKNSVVGCADTVCGMRRVGGGVIKGREWWCENVSVTVAEMRRA